MRLPTTCHECLQIDSLDTELEFIQFPHDFIVDFTCSKRGHRNIAYIQELDWEMLITSAGIALSEGYPMEAVSGIAAGVERFMEYVTKVLCGSFGVSREAFEAAWKDVSRQSERQL